MIGSLYINYFQSFNEETMCFVLAYMLYISKQLKQSGTLFDEKENCFQKYIIVGKLPVLFQKIFIALLM